MTRSLLDDAFAHNVWATLQLIDTCARLSPEQQATAVPGTYGSVLDTMRHIAGSDSWYLFRITGDRSVLHDTRPMGISDLRAAMETNGVTWTRILAGDIDPDVMLVETNDDGPDALDATGIVLAQALHHGTDHRSQVCTALTTLDIEPPDIDVWSFGIQNGRCIEAPPAS